MGDELRHLPASGMAHDWGVMVSLHYVVPELTTVGEDHLSV